MFEKRYRITLLFNANKVYDRQVVEGVASIYKPRNVIGIFLLKRIFAAESTILRIGWAMV